jgi:hypothetical protein
MSAFSYHNNNYYNIIIWSLYRKCLLINLKVWHSQALLHWEIEKDKEKKKRKRQRGGKGEGEKKGVSS